MGCNCKRAMEFESKHGVPMEETKSQKYGRLFLRGVFFAIAQKNEDKEKARISLANFNQTKISFSILCYPPFFP